MKLEHFGMAEPGDCRLVFTASAEELAAALAKEQAAPDAPQDEEELLTAAVNRTILEGFDPLYRQLVQEQQLLELELVQHLLPLHQQLHHMQYHLQ